MNTLESDKIKEAIIARLRAVIDPETQVDVIRMRLVTNLEVDAQGKASYTFRPSSPFCPIAVFLAQQIKQAVATVPGVSAQHIRIEGYAAAEELTQLINLED